jgi:hypothetical protein
MLKSCQVPGPRKGLVLLVENRDRGRHFLTISVTGSRRQTILAPKGATPIGGESFSEFTLLLRRTAKKNSRKWTGTGSLCPPITKQEKRDLVVTPIFMAH